MPNPHRLDLVHKAICAGIGNIEWKDQAYERSRDSSEMQGLTPKGIRMLLHEFCINGGTLEVRQEQRPEWIEEDPDNPYWYRARIPGFGPGNVLFVEVIILDYDEEEPFVQIVNSHF